MKKVIAFGFLAALLATGCGDDKKVAIPTKLDNSIPKVATSGGGGEGVAPKDAAGKGKAKGPGGGAKAD